MRTSIFNGEEGSSKTECTFNLWIFKVRLLMPIHSKAQIKGTILWSVKGAAAVNIQSLGPDAQ